MLIFLHPQTRGPAFSAGYLGKKRMRRNRTIVKFPLSRGRNNGRGNKLRGTGAFTERKPGCASLPRIVFSTSKSRSSHKLLRRSAPILSIASFAAPRNVFARD